VVHREREAPSPSQRTREDIQTQKQGQIMDDKEWQEQTKIVEEYQKNVDTILANATAKYQKIARNCLWGGIGMGFVSGAAVIWVIELLGDIMHG
jgi:hypothetical protein